MLADASRLWLQSEMEKIILGGGTCTGAIIFLYFVQFRAHAWRQKHQKKYCSRARSASKDPFFHISGSNAATVLDVCRRGGLERYLRCFTPLEFLQSASKAISAKWTPLVPSGASRICHRWCHYTIGAPYELFFDIRNLARKLQLSKQFQMRGALLSCTAMRRRLDTKWALAYSDGHTIMQSRISQVKALEGHSSPQVDCTRLVW